MLVLQCLLALTALARAATSVNRASPLSLDPPPLPDKIVRGAYIVQIECPSSSIDDLITIEQHVSALLQRVTSRIPHVKTRHLYQSDLFCGFSLLVGGDTSAAHLKAVEGVKNVYPVQTVHLHHQPSPHSPKSHDDRKRAATSKHLSTSDAASNQAEVAADGTNPEEQLGFDDHRSRASSNDTFSPHVMTGVDELHRQGLLGDPSVLVCLLDSGVDYKNRILGGGFGPGHKIAFGYNFVRDNASGSDATPYGDCEAAQHGTHTTGTVGANPNEFGFAGVVPRATIGHYRIFGCEDSGQSTSDTVLAALLRAAKDKCNVVNMSFGSPSGWNEADADDPRITIVDRLVERGVFVVGASGNDAVSGLYRGMSPGTAGKAFAVGSVDVDVFPRAFEISIEGPPSRPPIPYFSTFPVNVSNSLSVYVMPPHKDEDASCSEYSSPPPLTLQNSLVVVRRGPCSKKDRKMLIALGARVVFYYDAEDGQDFTEFAYGTDGTPGLQWLLHMPLSEALKLLSYYKANSGKLEVNFRSKRLITNIPNTLYGGQVSSFSSYGPTNTLDRPGAGVVSPGGLILSTHPRNVGGIGIEDGTSMAAPFVAGVAALLLSHRKADKLSPLQLQSLLTTTAEPVPVKRGLASSYSTVIQQGGGLIHAKKAYDAKTFISPFQLALNDSDTFVKTHVITLTNANSHPVTYTFGSRSAQSLATYANSTAVKIGPSYPPPVIPGSARVTFNLPHLAIAPGKSATFSVSIEPPNFIPSNKARYPFFSGWIMIDAPQDPAHRYSVPFFGLAASLAKAPILDSTAFVAGPWFNVSGLKFPFLGLGQDIDSDTNSPGTILTDPVKVTRYNRTVPLLINYRLAMPCERVAIDLVLANATSIFRPTIPPGNNVAIGQHTPDTPTTDSQSALHQPGRLYTSIPIVGQVLAPKASARNDEQPNTQDAVTSFAATFDGTINISSTNTTENAPPNTPYRLLLRALKLRFDPKYEESYESWFSPIFELES